MLPVASLLDAGSRGVWRVVGRPVDLDGAERWLKGPTSQAGPVGANWLQAAAEEVGGRLDEQSSAGTIEVLQMLDMPGA